MWSYNDTSELYHYGRKGMKWGQNIFGKKRSSGSSAPTTLRGKIEAKKKAKAKAKAAEEKKRKAEAEARELTKRKSVKKMSDAELKDRINRLKMEDDYRKLMNDNDTLTKGAKFVMGVLEKVGKDALEQTLAYAVENQINKTVFGGEDAIDPKNIQNRRKK